MWEYQAHLERLIDGDTYVFTVDLGLRVSTTAVVRLLGANAAEHNTAAGIEAMRWATGWYNRLASAGFVTIRTEKDKTEKYGRWLATVTGPLGQDLATDLIAAKMAVPWDGKGPRPVATGL